MASICLIDDIYMSEWEDRYMRTTVRLSDDLLRSAKKRAAEEGRTLTSLIEEGLKVVLAEPPN